MLEIGKTISRKGMGNRNGKMVLFTRVNTR